MLLMTFGVTPLLNFSIGSLVFIPLVHNKPDPKVYRITYELVKIVM